MLCIKDGISIEDIRNYVCPNIVPILERNNIDHALATLFEGTINSYFMQEETIVQKAASVKVGKYNILFCLQPKCHEKCTQF